MLASAHRVEAPALLIVGEVARRGASRAAIAGADAGRVAAPESAINADLR
jgi:hypothetical protein